MSKSQMKRLTIQRGYRWTCPLCYVSGSFDENHHCERDGHTIRIEVTTGQSSYWPPIDPNAKYPITGEDECGD